MDPSALPPPVVRAPADQVRATRDLERAALIGALIAGAVGWAIGGLLLHGVYASRPPDGFKTLSYLGSLFLVSWCAAYLGGLAGVVAGLIRSTDPQVRRPRVIAAMALFALVPTLLLAFAGLLLSPLGGPVIAGVWAVVAPALAIRWGLRLGYPSAPPEDPQPRCSST